MCSPDIENTGLVKSALNHILPVFTQADGIVETSLFDSRIGHCVAQNL
jgi:hypothetical protein